MAAIEPDPSLATRRSLITRLKNWDDQEGWREFFQTYWKLIYSVAIKSGLTDAEAEDVVQETVVTVAKTMGTYRYDRRKCRFKTWLMRITRMRIVDQLRKRGPEFQARASPPPTTDRTPTVERIPDPAPLEAMWDEEWHKNLVDAAMDRVKRRVRPEHYQIFYLSAVKNLSARHVARTMGVSTAQVYLVKHRVAAQVRKEIQRLDKDLDRDAQAAWTAALASKTKNS
jgi:RNA polymerase sigma-70 factor (ECF subfamily)